ncbi:MAG: insulinase family protein [Deltaproteobacteria bacterium]|nr:insulinase family protein [Deltaproteobacteria bacterium]
MAISHGFKKIWERHIYELKTEAAFFRHVKTGTELLSLSNEDENKVFGITFRTPASDSTGLPHILEHSVLCGSRKYPVKEPFVELLKGSLQTFLNAMTYPDKTCYPLASQNVQDFYNLIDVYLDAVFYPRLTPMILQQEGWHLELEKADEPLIFKGVVFNEMKGVYSSPDSLLSEYSQQSLFPDNTYGFDSGGNPKEIPNLTFKKLKAFHRKYYHPSNARIFFYGDDDPEKRVHLVDEYLKDFKRLDIDSAIEPQRPFKCPRELTRSFPAGEDESSKGMVTLNWLLKESADGEANLAFHVLEYILLGMPGSPLRKALIDSNLGEDLCGGGLGSELRQMYFSTGLKGIDLKDIGKVVRLIQETLFHLTKEGIDPETVEAALNTIEFSLRENNTGAYPRGLGQMLRALNSWLYDKDPLTLITFETPLESLKARLSTGEPVFEGMIDNWFIGNPHRTTLILRPDKELAQKEEAAEQEKLSEIREAMTSKNLQDVVRQTRDLKQFQETPDSPEALATIPTLSIEALDKRNRTIPSSVLEQAKTPILYHDLFTNGIIYLDVGFDLHALPQRLLPYVHLFGRALLEMGTETEDYVSLSQRISRKTGGIRPSILTSAVKEEQKAAAWLFLRGKAMKSQTMELMDILRDILLNARLDRKDRFRQMVLEAKARQEQKLMSMGHQMVSLRLSAQFHEAEWAAEQMSGVTYLFFLRRLAKALDDDWSGVLADMEEIRSFLINRNAMLLNITLEETGWSHFRSQVNGFLEVLPVSMRRQAVWSPERPAECEGMTIPSQVNYVAKGVNIFEGGYRFHGSSLVICRYLRNTWLWDRIRVRGGAYGGFCHFDRFSGVLSFVSYRDPNLSKTLEVFDQTADFLNTATLHEDEIIRSIIGTIGDIDQYMLPDAKGFASMLRHITGQTEKERQQIREEVLNTTASDFRSFGQALEILKERGLVKVLGPEKAIQGAQTGRQERLRILKVI